MDPIHHTQYRGLIKSVEMAKGLIWTNTLMSCRVWSRRRAPGGLVRVITSGRREQVWESAKLV